MKIDPSKITRNAAVLLLATIGVFALTPLAVAQPLSLPLAQQQVVPEPDLVAEVAKATAYPASEVQVTAGAYQLVVTLLNSKLASPSDRQEEAAKIAAAISKAIASKPQFKLVQAFHIDYINLTADRFGAHMVDAIDFRKNPAGSFVHNKS